MKFGEFTLETERMVLRKPRLTDAPDFYTIYGDEEGMKYWSSSPFTSVKQAEEMISHRIGCWDKNDSLCFAMEEKQSGRVLGNVNLFSFAGESRRAEIGYILARPFWRQGYATEGVRPVLEYAFRSLKLNRLEADIDPANVASAALLQKLGFTLEGVLRQRWIVNGVVSDSHMFGLLAGEYNGAAV